MMLWNNNAAKLRKIVIFNSFRQNKKCSLTISHECVCSWNITMRFQVALERDPRVKSGKFGHQVNSETYLQTVEIQMRRLLMSRLIRIFTVCWVNLVFISITELWYKLGGCPNLAVRPNIAEFTLICSWYCTYDIWLPTLAFTYK